MPRLFEVNARCWLRELSESAGQPLTLAEVPEREFARWVEAGFTHVWLMGIWPSGPRARAEALAQPALLQAYAEALPDWAHADVAGSPYAVADYEVAEVFGGAKALKVFRQKLHRHHLRLLLDFVPNHLGLDHEWVLRHPHYFVQSSHAAPGTFPQKLRKESLHLAQGRDPFFSPWTDTVQLDYRKQETRAAMTEVLLKLAGQCDGVRCDMAMLALSDVFAKTWASFPLSEPEPPGEFWQGAIEAVKAAYPDFTLLAEVYWGRGRQLRELGFDYTYDKELYDRIVAPDPPGVQRHLLKLSAEGQLSGGAHFLENHDERRIASTIGFPLHRAAALLVLALPGLAFLHEGQLEGRKRRLPVQLIRRAKEVNQPEVREMYDSLFGALGKTSLGCGESRLLAPHAAWAGNPSAENVVLLESHHTKAPGVSTPAAFELVAVNLASHRSQCVVELQPPFLGVVNWRMKDLLGRQDFSRADEQLRSGLFLDLEPFGAQIFQFTPLRERES